MRGCRISQVLSSEKDVLIFSVELDDLMVLYAQDVVQGMLLGSRYRGGQRYLRKDCKRTFNDKTGTLFHYSGLQYKYP